MSAEFLAVPVGGLEQTLPSSWYYSDETFALEKERIFCREWLCAGREEQVPRPGDHLVLDIVGESILIVRNRQGVLRAFYNVCRHRAGPLALRDGRGAKRLRCHYHGWSYALDGRLLSAPEMDGVADFDIAATRLPRARVVEWRGLVFANLDDDAPSLDEVLDGIASRLGSHAIESYVFHSRQTYDIACNWKTYVENYLEGYHIPLVHPFLNSAVDATKYEVSVTAPVIFHQAPPRDGSPIAGLWAWAWPCLGVNVYADGILMERMWPLDCGHTRLDYLHFFTDGIARNEMERSITASEDTTREDKLITEAVQRNLDAGIYEKGRLSPKHEEGVAWFQREIARVLERTA